MLNSFLNKFTVTNKSFLEELYKSKLDYKMLDGAIKNKNIDINYQDKNKNSFLHLCIINKKHNAIKWLIQNNIDVRLKDNNGHEAISLALEKNDNYSFELLCKSSNIDLDILDSEKRTLLQNAVISGQMKIIKILLEYDIDVNNLDVNNRNVLFDAISFGDDTLTNLIINIPNLDFNITDIHGHTILHNKSVLKDDELATLLLEKGADPTVCNFKGENFLYHIALRGAHAKDMLDVIVQNGHSLDMPVKNNNSILIETLATFYKIPIQEELRRKSLLDMANILLDKGINPNAKNEYGENALFDAVKNNDYQTCAMLIKNKISIDDQNRLKQTPLLLACYGGINSLDIILLLLDNGANANIRNELDKSVLEILNELILHKRNNKTIEKSYVLMYENNDAQYLRVLKEVLSNTKHNLQELNSKGQPLFFEPMIYNNYELFKLYLLHGFDANSKNKQGLNLFFVYVQLVFKINRQQDDFKSNLIRLLQERIDMNMTDKDGKLIFSNIIKKETNINLYKDLLSVCKFRYKHKDKLGRTIMHYAVLNQHEELVQLIHSYDNDVANIDDSFNILPITYATLFSNFQIVEMFLNCPNIYVKSQDKIPLKIKEKFVPMLNKIDSLLEQTKDKDLLRKIRILIDQVKSDFKI